MIPNPQVHPIQHYDDEEFFDDNSTSLVCDKDNDNIFEIGREEVDSNPSSYSME